MPPPFPEIYSDELIYEKLQVKCNHKVLFLNPYDVIRPLFETDSQFTRMVTKESKSQGLQLKFINAGSETGRLAGSHIIQFSFRCCIILYRFWHILTTLILL